MTGRRNVRILAVVTAITTATLVSADQVVITTATITGRVRLGSLPIQSMGIQTSGAGVSATSTFFSPAAVSAPYSVVVGIQQGTTPTVNVSAFSVLTDSARDTLNFAPKPVTVNENSPTEVNFEEINPGFIAATINVSGGATLSSAFIQAFGAGQSSWTNTQPAHGFVFPVLPAGSLTINGSAQVVVGGSAVSLPLTAQVVAVAPGQTVPVTFNVTAPSAGTVAGTVQFSGAAPVSSITVTANGPLSLSQSFATAAYALTPLLPGNYTLSTTATLNAGDDFFSFNAGPYYQPSRSFTAGAGTTIVDVTAQQAYVNGTLRLTGLQNLPDIASGFVFARNLSTGATGRDQLNGATDRFDIITSDGTWRLDLAQSLRLLRANPFLDQTIFTLQDFTSGRQFTTAAGATTELDSEWPVGEVTVRMVLASGGLLSQPALNGSCSTANSFYNFSSTSNQVNVAEGRVSWVGPAGTCTITGTVRVNGVTVSIPTQTLTVVAGVSQDVDAGGPSLTVNAPAPNSITTSNVVSVSGLADDDTAVATVTVNGVAATLTPTNNPTRPAERAFAREVTLAQKGPNSITTVVRDVANPPKQTTDTRVVYWDDAAPFLSFTPAVDTSTFNTSIVVAGVADDDAGVKRITLNGEPIAFTPTANPSKPKEVSFTATVTLAPGVNPVAVSVTDISERVTSHTRSVTRLTQRSTTLTATDVTASYGGSATLTARLLDQEQMPVAGKTVRFTIFGMSFDGTTSATGDASVSVSLASQTTGSTLYTVEFAGDTGFATSGDTGQLTIGAGEASLTLDALSHIFDGSPKVATVTTSPAGLSGVTITYDGATTPPTQAGSYAVVASLSNQNYEAASVAGTLVIARAPVSLTLTGLAATYDGTPKAVTVVSTPPSVSGLSITYNGSTSPPVDAGSYVVVASLSNPNYETTTATGTLVVDKALATLALNGLTRVFDGSPVAVTVVTTPGGLSGVAVAYDGSPTPPTNAGAYTVVARLSSGNYQAVDATGTLTIGKRDQTITFAALPARTFGDPPFALTATSSAGLPVTFAAGPNCTVAGSLVTLTGGGQCTVTASQSGDENHHAATPVARSFNVAHSWSGILQPVNSDGSSVFKAGSTVPIKFQLTGASANVTNLAARVYLTSVSNGVLGTEVEALSQVAADSGNVFRYDPTAGQYIFNLSTKGMSQGTWRVRVDLLDGNERSVLLSLRK